LPERLPIEENYDWGPEEEFIRYCYPLENKFALRSDLREHERQRLVIALKAVGLERLLSSFSAGHTIASKLLDSQVERLREIAKRTDDLELFKFEIEVFLTEPNDDPTAIDEEKESPE
jgi:hypothetical protein